MYPHNPDTPAPLLLAQTPGGTYGAALRAYRALKGLEGHQDHPYAVHTLEWASAVATASVLAPLHPDTPPDWQGVITDLCRDSIDAGVALMAAMVRVSGLTPDQVISLGVTSIEQLLPGGAPWAHRQG
jgi:hypothetical protein